MTYIGLNGGQKQVAVSDLETRTHFISFFDNQAASSKDEEEWTLPDLAGEIRDRSAVAKDKLPWLKMARFGEARSLKNSLRTNANTREITGIELDYDAATMSFDAAIEAFRAANLRVLLYTSASYIAGTKEKWRVLAPLSEPMAPNLRKDLAASVNAIIGGVADRASFVLSQAFYYGFVKGNNDHRVEVLDGDFIDQRPDLLSNKAYPPDIVKPVVDRVPAPAGVSPGRNETEIEGLLKASRKVNKHGERQWHNAMLSAIASMIGKGWTDAQIYTACQDYCDGGWGDDDIAELIRSGREKWQTPDPDKVMGGIGPVVAAAIEARGGEVPDFNCPPVGATREDYYAFLPTHQYIYKYTGKIYPMASINATLGKVTAGTKPKKQTKKEIADKVEVEMVPEKIPPSLWLDRNRAVMDMTWAPGEPQLIEGQIAHEGGWIERPGVSVFNLYIPPPARAGGDADRGARWAELVHKIYPEHAEHIIGYLAHSIQFPGVKIVHALVLVGAPGIGKDTLLEPISHGLGSWNFKDIKPRDILGNNDEYRKCLLLRISETHDLGDMSRFAFYNATKTLIASPPFMVRVNVKHVPQYYVPNVNSTVMTTNHGSDGLYLEASDRRHYVAGSEMQRTDHGEEYLAGIWEWYGSGGLDDAVAYLAAYDLSGFDAKRPPKQTPEFWRMVDTGTASEVPELRDAIDAIEEGDKNEAGVMVPVCVDAVVLNEVKTKAMNLHRELYTWLDDKRNRRAIPHRMETCGYVPIRQQGPEDGLWKIGKKRVTIYAKSSLEISERYKAAEELCKNRNDKLSSQKSDDKGNIVKFK